jgi:membrane protein DedA with SNARE-associated domain
MEHLTVLLIGLVHGVENVAEFLSQLLTPIDRFNQFLLELIHSLFGRFGYLVVFLGTCLENLLFLGVLVPGVVVLLLAGWFASDGLIDLRLAIVVAALGTSLGDTASYLAGRFGWRGALARAEQMPLMGTVRSTFMRRTGLFVLSYHFLGYTRLLGPLTAGALRIPFRRWWVLDALGAIVWVTVYILVGYTVGRLGVSFETAKANVEKLDRIFLVVAIVGVTTFLLVRSRSRGRVMETTDEAPDITGLPEVSEELPTGTIGPS